MKKPQWILIGITAMFACVLLGIFLGRNTSHNYIPINNGTTPITGDSSDASQSQQDNDGKININTATADELEQIPGVTPRIASNIVQYRMEYGKFISPMELLEVDGISRSLYDSIKIYVTTGN